MKLYLPRNIITHSRNKCQYIHELYTLQDLAFVLVDGYDLDIQIVARRMLSETQCKDAYKQRTPLAKKGVSLEVSMPSKCSMGIVTEGEVALNDVVKISGQFDVSGP